MPAWSCLLPHPSRVRSWSCTLCLCSAARCSSRTGGVRNALWTDCLDDPRDLQINCIAHWNEDHFFAERIQNLRMPSGKLLRSSQMRRSHKLAHITNPRSVAIMLRLFVCSTTVALSVRARPLALPQPHLILPRAPLCWNRRPTLALISPCTHARGTFLRAVIDCHPCLTFSAAAFPMFRSPPT